MNTNDRSTALHALHLECGARMVSFAGYQMPVQFTDGIIAEHLHTRDKAGLFDVSHMGQIRVTGANAATALESCIPIDIVGLAPGQQRYGFLTNDDGGIIDDLIVANTGGEQPSFQIVVNASRKDVDMQWLSRSLGDQIAIESMDKLSLLALQGPAAASVLAELAPAVVDMKFMQSRSLSLQGIDCILSRSGYTGEDGFEISMPTEQCETIARRLLEHDAVKPIGLGARDSLRLEAGLCLYGQDIDTDISPIEAGLGWAISRKRRTGGERAGGFPGAERILNEISNGSERRRVGIKPDGPAPLRTDTVLVDQDNNEIGRVTSGSFGASFDGPVSMALVASEFAETGTQISAQVRNKTKHCVVCELPFVAHRYKRG